MFSIMIKWVRFLLFPSIVYVGFHIGVTNGSHDPKVNGKNNLVILMNSRNYRRLGGSNPRPTPDKKKGLIL